MNTSDENGFTLQWNCPDHPKAFVRYSYETIRFSHRGYHTTSGVETNRKYECVDCGMELSPPIEED